MLQGGACSFCPGISAARLAATWNFRGFPSKGMVPFLVEKRQITGIFLIFPLLVSTYPEI